MQLRAGSRNTLIRTELLCWYRLVQMMLCSYRVDKNQNWHGCCSERQYFKRCS